MHHDIQLHEGFGWAYELKKLKPLDAAAVKDNEQVSGVPEMIRADQQFVRQLFKPGENPVGQRFGADAKSSGDWKIVGVVEDTAYQSATWNDHMMYFVSTLQGPLSADPDSIDKDENMYAGAIVLKPSRTITEMRS